MDKNTTQNAAPEVKKQGFLNLFLAGGKKGLNIWFNNMIPSIILGGLILAIIEETGLIDIIGNVMGPYCVMGPFCTMGSQWAMGPYNPMGPYWAMGPCCAMGPYCVMGSC